MGVCVYVSVCVTVCVWGGGGGGVLAPIFWEGSGDRVELD
jgi:hypothetical protein